MLTFLQFFTVKGLFLIFVLCTIHFYYVVLFYGLKNEDGMLSALTPKFWLILNSDKMCQLMHEFLYSLYCKMESDKLNLLLINMQQLPLDLISDQCNTKSSCLILYNV